MLRVERPGDRVVAGTDREVLARRDAAHDEDRAERSTGEERLQDRRPQRDRLGLQHHRREHSRCEASGHTERERAEQVTEVERRLGRDGEQPVGAVDRREREVSRRRRDECGEEHAAAEVILIRHLDREDRAGGRCLEDRGNSCRRARHHQKAAISVAEQPRQSLLGLRTDGRAEVERRPFESHRASEPERGDRRGDACDEGPDREEHIGIVVRAQVLVGRRTRHASTDERERGEREQQADGRRQCDHPQRELLDPYEKAVDDDALEPRHAEAGDRADESGDDHDLRGLLDDLAHAVTGVAHRGCHPAAHA